MTMTLKEKCVEILTAMLNREPTETELGNVMTDANIVNKALTDQQNDILTTQAALVEQAGPTFMNPNP